MDSYNYDYEDLVGTEKDPPGKIILWGATGLLVGAMLGFAGAFMCDWFRYLLLTILACIAATHPYFGMWATP
jgi:hypothetical protein